MLPAQMLAAQAPLAAALPSDERGPTPSPTAIKPARPSNPANRSHTPGVRQNALQHQQDEFSLKNWLEKLGLVSRPRNTRG